MFTETYPNPITIYKAANYNSIYKTTFITQTQVPSGYLLYIKIFRTLKY